MSKCCAGAGRRLKYSACLAACVIRVSLGRCENLANPYGVDPKIGLHPPVACCRSQRGAGIDNASGVKSWPLACPGPESYV